MHVIREPKLLVVVLALKTQWAVARRPAQAEYLASRTIRRRPDDVAVFIQDLVRQTHVVDFEMENLVRHIGDGFERAFEKNVLARNGPGALLREEYIVVPVEVRPDASDFLEHPPAERVIGIR